MPKLTIIRPYEWANLTKDVSIYVNDVKVGAVGINQLEQINVKTGKHKVVLKSKWGGGSKPLVIDFSNNKDRTFEIFSTQFTFLIAPLLFIIAGGLYHIIISTFNFQPRFISNALGLGLMYLVLFIPFYSRYYMKLKEVEIDESKKRTKEEQARLLRKIMALDEKDEVYEV